MNKNNEELISRYVLDNLKHKFIASVNQQITADLALNLQALYQDREGSFTKYENTLPVGETDYAPFWLFDAKLIYEKNNISVFGSVNNVFNTSYNDIENVIQPGRWFKAGISYHFSLKKM